ncbi:MAG: DUF4093 domain-containing protein [Clostridia bacterium]
MIKIKEAIIVEGKYDKQKLSLIVDTIIIETKGFRIFKDEEQKKYIKKIANERGIIILTDSDSAGFLIRNHLKSFIPNEQIKQAYVNPIKGKEKRKASASAEGLLGVEGVPIEEILKSLQNISQISKSDNIYKTSDLYALGLTGTENCKEKKEDFLKKLGLPIYLNNKDLLKYMNSNVETIEEIFKK